MAEAAIQPLKVRDKIELDLLREVELAGAKFHASLNGNRDVAAREFEEALRVFSDLIFRHQLRKT